MLVARRPQVVWPELRYVTALPMKSTVIRAVSSACGLVLMMLKRMLAPTLRVMIRFAVVLKRRIELREDRMSLKGQLRTKRWAVVFTAHNWEKEAIAFDCLRNTGRRQELLDKPHTRFTSPEAEQAFSDFFGPVFILRLAYNSLGFFFVELKKQV